MSKYMEKEKKDKEVEREIQSLTGVLMLMVEILSHLQNIQVDKWRRQLISWV